MALADTSKLAASPGASWHLVSGGDQSLKMSESKMRISRVEELEAEIFQLRRDLGRTMSENEVLAMELSHRPTRADMNAVLRKLRKYEAVIEDRSRKDASSAAKSGKHQITCDRELEELANWSKESFASLRVSSAKAGSKRIREVLQAERRASQYESVLLAVEQRLARLDAPRNAAFADWFSQATNVSKQDASRSSNNAVPLLMATEDESESPLLRRFQCLPKMAQSWLDELTMLPSLTAAVNRLVSRIVPYQVTPLAVTTAPEACVCAVLDRLELCMKVTAGGFETPRHRNNSSSQLSARSNSASRDSLAGRESGCDCDCVCECRRALQHFCTLFGSATVSGSFAKMNEVYSRVGEAENMRRALTHALNELQPSVMRRLCDDSDSRIDGSADLKSLGNANAVGGGVHVVASVQKIVDALNARFANADADAEQHSRAVEKQCTLDLVHRVREYERFLPAFHKLVHELLEATGVDRIDMLVPSVRALRTLVGSNYRP